MENQTGWKSVFLTKAVINWIEAVVLFLGDGLMRQFLQITPLVNVEYLQMLAALIFVIGIGYWWVGNDLQHHRDIVKLGIYAQSAVALLVIYHIIVGNLHPFYLIPGGLDLIFAIIFTRFLADFQPSKAI